MSVANSLTQRLSSLREGQAYRKYERVREEVLRMKAAESAAAEQPSTYWQEELGNFEYMLDASPLIIEKLRQHAFHVTGIRTYEYRSGADELRAGVADKLAALRELDKLDLHVSEPRELGGFGFEIDGGLYNLDTLKFYEALIALQKGEVLQQFLDQRRRVVVEIGPGFGGFAYQFRTLFPNTCYVLVDLPELFLFSSVYLTTLFPDARVAFWDESKAFEPHELVEYDFVFAPNTAVPRLRIDDLALAINMISFQEMTSAQVDGYVRWLHELECPFVYSLNRDKSGYNPELRSVREILATRFWLHEISVLPIAYTKVTTREELEKRVRKQAGRATPEASGYHHVIGWRRIHVDDGEPQLERTPGSEIPDEVASAPASPKFPV